MLCSIATAIYPATAAKPQPARCRLGLASPTSPTQRRRLKNHAVWRGACPLAFRTQVASAVTDGASQSSSLSTFMNPSRTVHHTPFICKARRVMSNPFKALQTSCPTQSTRFTTYVALYVCHYNYMIHKGNSVRKRLQRQLRSVRRFLSKGSRGCPLPVLRFLAVTSAA